MEERENLLQAIQGLSEEEVTLPQMVGEWSVKDILGHIAYWEREMVRALECHLQGEPPYCFEVGDLDEWNAKQVEVRREMPLEAIMADLTTVRERLLAALNPLTDEELGQPMTFPWGEVGTLSRMGEMCFEHGREHGQGIREWRVTRR